MFSIVLLSIFASFKEQSGGQVGRLEISLHETRSSGGYWAGPVIDFTVVEKKVTGADLSLQTPVIKPFSQVEPFLRYLSTLGEDRSKRVLTLLGVEDSRGNMYQLDRVRAYILAYYANRDCKEAIKALSGETYMYSAWKTFVCRPSELDTWAEFLPDDVALQKADDLAYMPDRITKRGEVYLLSACEHEINKENKTIYEKHAPYPINKLLYAEDPLLEFEAFCKIFDITLCFEPVKPKKGWFSGVSVCLSGLNLNVLWGSKKDDTSGQKQPLLEKKDC